MSIVETFKDDVFSVGLLTVELCLTSASLDLFNLNKDQEALSKAIDEITALGYSASLVNIIKKMCEFNEEERVDFLELDLMIKEALGGEKIEQILNNVTLCDQNNEEELKVQLANAHNSPSMNLQKQSWSGKAKGN
mmetsp:Transcript_48009/g.35214  ORF Transcript_48009/g.35214 Transcript_48009/m.35214 type:complete len:136 (+) Transcript_48009:631-1038(+)